jgi:hypothetical protein
MHASAQDRTGDLARVKRMHETLCKLPQYQSFKINTKFIHLILPQSSLGFVSLKQQKEH